MSQLQQPEAFLTSMLKYCSPIYFFIWLIVSNFILCFVFIYCILKCFKNKVHGLICVYCVSLISATLVSIIVFYIVQSSQLSARVLMNDLIT